MLKLRTHYNYRKLTGFIRPGSPLPIWCFCRPGGPANLSWAHTTAYSKDLTNFCQTIFSKNAKPVGHNLWLVLFKSMFQRNISVDELVSHTFVCYCVIVLRALSNTKKRIRTSFSPHDALQYRCHGFLSLSCE